MSFWTVRDSAVRLAAVRYVEVQLMECFGGWIHSTPNLDIKIRFSYDAYKQAEFADKLGMRLWQMRVPRHYTQAANDGVVELCKALWQAPQSAARIAGAYTVIKESLLRAYERFGAMADPIADEPSRRLATQIAHETRPQVILGKNLLQGVKWSTAERAEAHEYTDYLRELLKQSGGLLNVDDNRPLGAQARTAQAFAKERGHVSHGRRPANWNVVDVRDLPACDPFSTPQGRRYALHTLLNREYMAAEARGKMLSDFQDLPWLLRMDLARQTWDEARHAEILTRRLTDMDVRIGTYPVYYSTAWEAEANEPDPMKRLAYTNRIGEPRLAGQMAAWREEASDDGDRETSRQLDYILGDEAVHVQYGDWVVKLASGSKDRLKDALMFGAQLAIERAQQNRAANFQWQAKKKPVGVEETDHYILRSLHAEGLDADDVADMYSQLGIRTTA